MRGKRKDLPASYEGMEKRFLDAIERLKEGKPVCPELQKKAKAGKLRVSDVSAVALEAGGPDEKGVWRGLSRTLIGHDNCRYPKVREKIRKAKEGEPGEYDLKNINSTLRERNRQLEKTNKQLLSSCAAMLVRMNKLESAVKEEVKKLQREQHRGDRPVHQAPTLVVDNVRSEQLDGE
jgi:predicted metal-dependent hydrolase